MGEGDGQGDPAAPVGLAEAAERLGVHYMTAYRYVRTGRLAAVKVGGEWQVRPDDLARVHVSPGPDRRRPARRSRARQQLEQQLVAGDEVAAWNTVEGALAAGADASEIELVLLAPALRSIGDRWEAGELTVADEHRASVVARRILGRLGTRFTRRGRKRGAVVVGAPAGERHEIPVSMVADHLRGARFEVVDLGPDVPADSFAHAAARHRPLAVLIGVTGSGHEQAIGGAVDAVRRVCSAPLLVGGGAVAGPGAAVALGADAWTGTDARAVVAAVEALGRR